MRCLVGSTADEEPLVNGAVNLLGLEILVRGKSRDLVGRNETGGALDRGVATILKLVKWLHVSEVHSRTYIETPLAAVLPVIRRSQASPHSRTTSRA
jgi:hypothetical protein